MKHRFSIKRLALTFTVLLLCAVFSSCEPEPKPKRAYIIAKTDDDNWTTSAQIECDSVNMVSAQHAVYWVNGRSFNLYAKSFIKVASNPYYVSP
jgi:hypothetical protein